MKKMLALLLACLTVVGLFAGCAGGNNAETTTPTTNTEPTKPADPKEKLQIAMIEDEDTTAHAEINKTVREAVQKWTEEKDAKLATYKLAGENNVRRKETLRTAIVNGANVVVVAGSSYASVVLDLAGEFSNVKFVAVEVSDDAILKAAVTAVGEIYDGNPDNWDIKKYADYENLTRVADIKEMEGKLASFLEGDKKD